MTMEDRLTELEIKLGYAEDLLEALNRTVFRQQQQMEQLQQEVRALRNQLESSIPGEQRSLADEVPPHY
jgi:SlyX protein